MRVKLDKWDKKLNFINLDKLKIASLLAILLALFHLVTTYHTIGALKHRSVHLTAVLALIFLLKPLFKERHRLQAALDTILFLASLGLGIYLYLMAGRYVIKVHVLQPLDVLIGWVGIFLVFEGTRRTIGWVMPVIAAAFLAYAFLGPYIPLTMLSHRGYGLNRIVDHMFFTMEGILGTPIRVSSTFVALFILLGAFLNKTGMGNFLMDLASSAFGRYRGGPAKVAILSSSLFGSISGSAVANVVTTGTLTIPLMKKVGYSPRFSGAIEAVASTGGQLMPPIMGSAAFIMVEFLGTSYSKIMAAGLLPALLYYFALFMMVDLEAAKKNLSPISVDNLPKFRLILWRGWPYLIPIVVLVYLIAVKDTTPQMAALWSILCTIIIGLLHPDSKLKNVKTIINSLEQGSKALLEIAMACASAGIIIGVITLTGLGMKLTTLLISIAGGSLPVLLILTAVACIILGMGVPTAAAYIIVASLVAPALVRMGIPPLAAHFFVFYFSIVSMITPPVAIAAYAAAGIAQADPNETGLTAVRLGITALIVPFMFVLGPQLLFEGDLLKIILSFATAIVGVFVLSVGMQGWFKYAWRPLPRMLVILSAFALIKPGILSDSIGLGLAVAGFVMMTVINKISPVNREKLFRIF